MTASVTSCPRCGLNRVDFDPGFLGTHDEPQSVDAWTCLDCGHAWTRDKWERLEDRADEQYEARRDRERGL